MFAREGVFVQTPDDAYMNVYDSLQYLLLALLPITTIIRSIEEVQGITLEQFRTGENYGIDGCEAKTGC